MKTGRRVSCTIYNASLAVGSLRSHLLTQHDVRQCFVVKDSEAAPLPPPWRYIADYYPADRKFRCPVPECPQGDKGYGCTTSFNLRCHFAFRHRGRHSPLTSTCSRGWRKAKCHRRLNEVVQP